MFEAEVRNRIGLNEDSLTAKAFGTLALLGPLALSRLLKFCFPQSDVGEPNTVGFWPSLAARVPGVTSKLGREYDVAILDSDKAPLAYVECKLDADLTLDQVQDEFRLAKEQMPSPRLVLLTAVDELPLDVARYVASEEVGGAIRQMTWSRLYVLLEELRPTVSQSSIPAVPLLDELQRLLDSRGLREAKGLKSGVIQSIQSSWQALWDLTKEIQLLVDDVDRLARSAKLGHLKQANGARLWRDGASQQMDWRLWLTSSIVFPFGDVGWYDKRPPRFETDSYLYLAFTLDEGHVYVGYWGNGHEVSLRPDLDSVLSRLPQLPLSISGNPGNDWQKSPVKNAASPLTRDFLHQKVSGEVHFDLFYSHSLPHLAEANIVVLRETAVTQLGILRDLVQDAGLRARAPTQ